MQFMADAFEHWLRGNAQKRAQIAYDEAGSSAQFEWIERTFTPELLATLAALGAVAGLERAGFVV